MSWKATAFVKPLTQHKDGTPLSAREKLILFVLADSHNEKMGNCAWIGIDTACIEALTSRSRFIELVNRLESKGTIRIERREGRTHRYFFDGLDPSDSRTGEKLHRSDSNQTPVRQLPDPTRPTATGPEPLMNHQEAKPSAPSAHINLILWSIEESQRTGESADEIKRQVNAGLREGPTA